MKAKLENVQPFLICVISLLILGLVGWLLSIIGYTINESMI